MSSFTKLKPKVRTWCWKGRKAEKGVFSYVQLCGNMSMENPGLGGSMTPGGCLASAHLKAQGKESGQLISRARIGQYQSLSKRFMVCQGSGFTSII